MLFKNRIISKARAFRYLYPLLNAFTDHIGAVGVGTDCNKLTSELFISFYERQIGQRTAHLFKQPRNIYFKRFIILNKNFKYSVDFILMNAEIWRFTSTGDYIP